MNREKSQHNGTSDWKGNVHEELAVFIEKARLDKDKVFSQLSSPYDEILLHGKYACEHDLVEKSLRSFTECARMRPDAFPPQLALGRIYMGQGLYSEAEKHIRRSAEISPDNFNILIAWLFLLNKTKQEPQLFSKLQEQLFNWSAILARQLGFSGTLDPNILRIDQPEKFCERTESEHAREEFSNNKYTLLHNVLPAEFLELVLRQQRAAMISGQMSTQPERGRHFTFDQPLSVIANYQLTSLVSEIVGEAVVPTYTFAIHYMPFGQMEVHTDRPQNELSMSLNLAVTPPADFPALLAGLDENKLSEIRLEPNSALFYRGPEVSHARCQVPAGHRVDQLVLGFRTVNTKHCSCFS